MIAQDLHQALRAKYQARARRDASLALRRRIRSIPALEPGPETAASRPVGGSRVTLPGASRVVGASLVVALFAVLLLIVGTSQLAPDRMPGAVVSPSPDTSADGSKTSFIRHGGAVLVGEELGDGVLRVVDDGTDHDLGSILDIAAGPDGLVWATTGNQLFQLGKPGVLKARTGGMKGIDGIDVIASDGTIVVERGAEGLATSDGSTWTMDSTIDWSGIDAPLRSADGSMWGFLDGRMARHGIDGWTVISNAEVFPEAYAAEPAEWEQVWGGSTAGTPDGAIWVATLMGGSISRFDGDGWEESMPLGGEQGERVLDLASGPNGTLWALMDSGNGQYLVKYDGRDWSAVRWQDVVARSLGSPEEIAAVGWDDALLLLVQDREGGDTTSAVIAFDGSSARRLTSSPEGEYYERLTVSPDGTLWALGGGGLYYIRADPASEPE